MKQTQMEVFCLYRFLRPFFLILLLLLCLAAFSACQTPEREPEYTWHHPSTEGWVADGVGMWGPDTAETDYDNLIGYTEYDVYPTDVDEIAGYLVNTKPGKAFYTHLDTLVEKYEDGEWKQLNYRYLNYDQFFGFGYCGFNPHRADFNHITRQRYFVKYVVGDIEPGEYRMLIFTPFRTFYLPFRFVSPEEYETLLAEGKVESRVTEMPVRNDV